jgi:nucleoside-diphosphate-sugar epimerase
VEEIAAALGRRLPPVKIPAGWALALARRAAEWGMPGGTAGYAAVRKWLAHDAYDGSRFEQAMGWRAQVALGEGLRREVTWYRSRRAA